MALYIDFGDITKYDADVIVNAANAQLRYGSGVCGAIFRAAGVEAMQRACDRYGGCKTGNAVITGGFGLKSKFVIHTVGPRYEPGNPHQANLLGACYYNSLELAKEFRAKSIVFPLIATGAYGYPKEEAAWIAIHAIETWLKHNTMDVKLVLADGPFAHQVASFLQQWHKQYG